ncbi:MAG: peptide-methionine (S)-S-oxide reductase MsrA [Chthoniobacterales bacterium]|nr:peptide-methionine (S)-S-oxide reductase MsrA [Chthoniobacterales bacterium]
MSKIFLILLALVGFAAPLAQAQEASPAVNKTAVFAGGCFWCMQPPYDRAKGVLKTSVGYIGGKDSDANYSAVSGHKTQHREAIEVTYDPAQISYEKLLDIFWRQINPTQGNGQFADLGLSYQAAIYFASEEEKKAAEASKEALGKSGKFQKPIVTDILPTTKFYPAEEYHQKYYLKNTADYKAYSVGSGRAGYLEKLWGKEAKE